MAKSLTPLERFIAEIPADPRRAFDLRQSAKGLKRVTVTVPVEQVDTLKTFARFLLGESPETIETFRQSMNDWLRDAYEDWDEAEKRGEL